MEWKTPHFHPWDNSCTKEIHRDNDVNQGSESVEVLAGSMEGAKGVTILPLTAKDRSTEGWDYIVEVFWEFGAQILPGRELHDREGEPLLDLRARLLLLAPEESNQGHARHLHDLEWGVEDGVGGLISRRDEGLLASALAGGESYLEANTGDITDGVTATAETGNQDLILTKNRVVGVSREFRDTPK